MDYFRRKLNILDMEKNTCANCGTVTDNTVLIRRNVTCLPCANEIMCDDNEGERAFMRAEAANRDLTEDETFIYLT